jgi:DNA primase
VRFDDRFLDEIKSRLRLSDVIGRTVKLKRQGREFVGLSPFNKEKSPSFYVNDDKGFFHDFSSGKHGDLIGFLQETERLTFVEAVERLAAEAGVPLPAPDARSAEQERERAGLADWVEQAARWFEGELRRPGGREVRDYLARRGLPESEWARFRIGYAPQSRTGLKDYLIAKGARPGELVEAGLLIAPEEGGAPYDRFRERLIFPITDPRGRVISFGGRALDPNARAKYLNGPDSPLFDKGRVLYGLAEARKLQHAQPSAPGVEDPPVVVVEGYMDVIACQRAGIAAVAPMGTALTEGQMDLLWRAHPEPTLCFDGDNAGRRAASRAIDRALPLLKPGKSFRFAIVSGGKDPDDVLRELGPAALKAQLSETTPFVDALFTRERDAEVLDTPERRAGLKQRLRQAAKTIADEDLAQQYRQELFTRFDALFTKPADAQPTRGRGGSGGSPRRSGPRGKGGWDTPPIPLFPTDEGKAGAKRLQHDLDPIAAAVAQGAMDDPHRLDDHLEAFEVQGFGDQSLGELAKEIIRLRLEVDVLDSGLLKRHLAGCGFATLLTDINRAAAKASAPFLKKDVTLATARSQWSHAFETLSRMAALEDALATVKLDLAEGSNAASFMRLKTERDNLKRAIKSGTIWTDDGS